MKTVGIIAEYNPFHNGHAYQIKRAKELSGADYAVIVMSGNFTQRGIPGIIDKYERTKNALNNGADLVLELPTVYATASAEIFAYGAVMLLQSLGTSAISFGCETDDLSLLSSLCENCLEESVSYKKALNQGLKEGMTFPAARLNALSCCYSLKEEELALLSMPNTILGLEYMKALRKLKSPMSVFPVKREGSHYLDKELPENSFASADAIRQNLHSGSLSISHFVPKDTCEVLKHASKDHALLFQDDFSTLLFYKLLNTDASNLTGYSDVSDSLAQKIRNNLYHFTSISDFSENHLKSKDITMARIHRALLHILLDITKENVKKAMELKNPCYYHVLGFREEAKGLFKEPGFHSCPLLCQLSELKDDLSEFGRKMLETDIRASHIYEAVKTAKSGQTMQNEFSRKLIKI